MAVGKQREQAVSDPGRRRWSRLLPPWAVVGWTGLWIGVAALVVLPYMHSYRHLSPFDETVHLDYLVKIQHGHLVRGGERIGPVAMRTAVCRGSDLKDYQAPRCPQKVLRPGAFPFGGFNTAYPDPPVYYVVTALGADVVGALPGVHDVVTAARSIGVLWLGAGLSLTFFLALRLGANRWAATGATLIVASNPAVAHAMATITSDAPSLLVGALLCLVALSFVRGQAAWWWLVPAAAATTAVKATGLMIVGLVVIFLLLQLVGSSRSARTSRGAQPEVAPRGPQDHPETDVTSAHTTGPTTGPTTGLTTGTELHPATPDLLDRPAPLPRRALWLGILAVVVPPVLVLGCWTVVNKLTELPAVADITQNQYFYVDSIGWDQLISNLLNLLTPLQNGYLPPSMVNPTIGVLMAFLNLVAIAGVATLAWSGGRGTVQTRLAIATAASMVLGGIALVLLIFVGSHTYIAIPSRYGLSLVPALAASLAVVASGRRAGGLALTGLGAATLVALLAGTL